MTKEIIGYLPQEFGFYPEFTVQQYLEYISALKGLTDRQAKDKIDELLSLLSLEDVRKKKIIKLSGGMKIPQIMRIRVVLPEPLAPRSPQTPGVKCRFTFSTAFLVWFLFCLSLKCFDTFSKVISIKSSIPKRGPNDTTWQNWNSPPSIP